MGVLLVGLPHRCGCPNSNILAHFSCVIVVSAAQRAASKTDAAGCAVGHLLAKSSHGCSWLALRYLLAIRFAHERGALCIAGRADRTSQRTRCGVVLTAFAGALPDLVGSLALGKWEMQPSPGDADERRRHGRCPNNARAERRRGEARLGPQMSACVV